MTGLDPLPGHERDDLFTRAAIGPDAVDIHLFEHQALDLDADDVADLLAGVADEEVHDFKPDDRFPDRTAIVMRIRRDQLTLYVKVSVQVALFDVAVLSCHRWGM